MIILPPLRRLFFSFCWLLVLPTAVFAGPKKGADAGEEARAAYPRPFARPRAAGPDYDTWQNALGPDVGEVRLDPARLPSRVDNSARPQFPPVYRQRWGSCGQFAAIASIFTYEMNLLNGTVADSDATRFPSHFSWNMMNRAENKGSEAYHGWEVAKRVGIPTARSYGGVRLDKIGVWPNGYRIWREAMEYRVAGYRYSPANTVAQLHEARGWLYDRNTPTKQPGTQTIGGLFALDGRMGELKKVTRTIPEGEHAAGEDVWIRWGPSGYGHGITCVGYDDEVGVDVNGDGKITNDLDLNGDGKVTLADWERGAYIVVNSWGRKWSQDGRIYLLYSAMIDPTWKRGNFLGRIEVKRHQPRWTFRFKMSCRDRADLRLSLGLAGEVGADAPDYEMAPEAFNGWPLFGGGHGGHVPLAGPDDDTPLEAGVDLTPLFERLGPDRDGRGRLFLKIALAENSEAWGELLEGSIRRYSADGALLQEIPIGVRDGHFGNATFALACEIDGLRQK